MCVNWYILIFIHVPPVHMRSKGALDGATIQLVACQKDHHPVAYKHICTS